MRKNSERRIKLEKVSKQKYLSVKNYTTHQQNS